MDPEAALTAQIERYRSMTGEQRLAIALDLRELNVEDVLNDLLTGKIRPKQT